jgi:CheY-like chemotaxis protein
MDALAAPQDGPTAVLRRIKILHIEDDPGVARAVARLLSVLECEVTSAASGADAVQVVAHGLIPEVILADYRLPFEITGDQVVAEIATRLGFRPVTIMLASSPPPNMEKVMSVVDRFFEKPADMLLVLRDIQELLMARNKLPST